MEKIWDSRRNLSFARLARVGLTTLGSTLVYQLFKQLNLNLNNRDTIKNKVVLITGGSRGLGLAVAEEFWKRGAIVCLCARNRYELAQAKKKILLSSHQQMQKRSQKSVHTQVCDVSNPREVHRWINTVFKEYRSIDSLINNAGTIDVGPLDALQIKDFQNAIEVNLMAMIRTTYESLRFMRRGARIVNISSIGGTVAVPHLLSYSVSKFGALGFSLGLDAELSKKGISVTSVLPGLMRTGSYVHAQFRGQTQKEFNWFSLLASLPLFSISARRAAREIFEASVKRKRFVVLGPQAKLLRFVYQLFPESSLMLMRTTARLLPVSPVSPTSTIARRGKMGAELTVSSSVRGFTRLADQAGEELNENQAA